MTKGAKKKRAVVGLVSLASVAFVVLGVVGVSFALRGAPSDPSVASSVTAGEESSVSELGAGPLSSLIPGLNVRAENRNEGTGGSDGTLPERTGGASEGAATASADRGSSTGTTGSASGGSSSKPSTPAQSGSGSTPETPAPSSPPAQSSPQKTYHPAWDEWVEEGHSELVTRPATYGERPVYGSVCNECGENVSGRIIEHFKETHHSGYHDGVIGYETYEITPARTDEVWVDTSHWVHHAEYWD
jgi:hypothetical protein